MAKVGFTQGQTNDTLTKLVTITGSGSAALGALGTAADLARYKHISLTDASLQLGKAASGNTRALKELGISTKDLPAHFGSTGTEASRLSTVMGLLNPKIGGQAAAAASTFGGKIDVLKAQVTNLSAKLGTALIPIMSKVVGWAIQGFNWFTKLPGPMKMIIGVALGAAAALKGMALAQDLLNLAMDANPIGLVIIGLAALAVGLKYAWDHSETFRRIVTAAWKGISDYARIYWAVIRGVINAMVGAYQWCANTIRSVSSAISNSWNSVKNAASSAVNGVVDFFRKMPGRITGAVGNLGHLLYQGGLDVVTGLWNGIKAVWNNVYGWFKGLPGKILHALGIASPPTWAIDAGKHIMNGILMSLVKGGGAVKNYFVGLAKDVGGPLAKTWSSIYGGSLMGGNKMPATGSLQQYAMSLLNSLGWGNQWPMFNALVMGESGWNPHAQNPSSGAYGIPQALPAAKMASAGSDWATSGFTQLRWMMSYIGQRLR